MVLGAVIAVDAGAVVGLDQLEAVLVEILERLIVAIDVIENPELQRHFSKTPRLCTRHVEPIIWTCHAFIAGYHRLWRLPHARYRRRDHRRNSRPFRALPARAQAQAQDWPAKQITIVVPFGAGGSADLLARILATHMQAKFGQTVVVENRAGAGGSIGTNYVAKAAPDGYTLLLGTVSSIAVNAALYAKLPFDVDKDIQPITQLVSFPNLLIVNPKLPINNVQELIDYVKKNEGKVNYASSGLGTSSHLSVVMFEQAIGTKMTHVPYKSTGDVVNSMLGGNVDIAIDSMTTVWPHAKQGTVRALGV